MTDFFPYDELTWPEVADLPRNTPLVLSLGSGYDLACFNLLAPNWEIHPVSISCHLSHLVGVAADWPS